MKEYWELFWCMAKIGVMTFGGGYAMLPMLEREIVDRKHWISKEEMMDYYAIGQCTPGVIAVNTATFVGEKRKGVSGGIIATLGMVFPSLVIIIALSKLIHTFSSIVWVQNALSGIRVCVCVLVFNAVISLYKAAVVDKITFTIYVAVFALSLFFDVSSIALVVISAIAGILFYNRRKADNA